MVGTLRIPDRVCPLSFSGQGYPGGNPFFAFHLFKVQAYQPVDAVPRLQLTVAPTDKSIFARHEPHALKVTHFRHILREADRNARIEFECQYQNLSYHKVRKD